MHFVLTVSTGATITRASATPAPRPATEFLKDAQVISERQLSIYVCSLQIKFCTKATHSPQGQLAILVTKIVFNDGI